MKCKVKGCERVSRSDGYCGAHLQRWLKTGDPGSAEIRARTWKISPDAVCAVDGCGGKVAKKGLCGKHYQKSRLYGDPLGQAEPRKRLSMEEALLKHLKRGAETDCWEWQASFNPKGYGKINATHGEQQAHRAAYRVWVGDIPDGLCVLHRCDNPRCCNPKHLFLGDNNDNTQDMIRKGRDKSFGKPRKLSDGDVRRIRDKNHSVAYLRERYGISAAMVTLIRARKSYANVD